jgi:hypothetical protein
MRSLVCAIALALVLPTTSTAQKIRGAVVEDSTGWPISGAKIELLSADAAIIATSFSAVTGWFEVYPESAGQFLVRASHPAYRGTDTLLVDIRSQEIITVVLQLSGGPIPLEPVVVKALDRLSRYRERARRGAFGHFITRADIDKRGGYNLSHVLRFTPEVRIERVRDGPFTSEGVFMRSFGDLCVPAIYLDGIPVPTGRVFDINDLISAEAVEGIEVYRDAQTAPLEFRLPVFPESDMSCGVIVVWSRPLPRARFTVTGMLFGALLVGGSLLLPSFFK